MLTFGSGSGDASNRPFPFIDSPQAILASLWDDLVIGGSYNSGKVYYQAYSATQFVISYIGVTKLGGSSGDVLTFQVILESDGDIILQYKDLNGTLNSASIGIEDHDGVVGLTYLHNTDMSALEGKALRFIRPADRRRPKVLPLYQGGFTVNNKRNMELSVANAGDLGPDSFDLAVLSSNITWQVRLYDAAGQLITKDTNGNGHVETPLLNPGEAYSVTVEVIAPSGSVVGATAAIDLTASSLADGSAPDWAVRVQSTIPASFAQALKDSGDIDLRAISRFGQREITVFPLYTGSTMGVEALDQSRFMMYWERNGNRGLVTWTDIEQAVVNDFGQDYLHATKITNNSVLATVEQNVHDSEPVTVSTSDGKIAIVWMRRKDRDDGKSNHNIYMAVLDANDTSKFIKRPFCVTQNGIWGSFPDENIPEYASPRITVTPDNNYLISWTDERLISNKTESNIGIASYTNIGIDILGPQHYAGLASIPGDTLYRFSSVYGLSDNLILLGYSSYDDDSRIYTPGYAVINVNGATIHSPTLLPGVEGQFPTALQLPGGSIIYAWTKTTTENNAITSSQIAYVLIDPSSYVASSHLELTTPDGLQSDYVSLTYDENGNAIFTWLDTDLERKLYYALVDPSGALITPAMSFYETETSRALLVNQTNRGNAFYIYRFGVYLPIIVR